MLTMSRVNTLLLVLVLLTGVAIVAIVANAAQAGPLDPPSPPASSMIPIDEAGSWSQTLADTGGCTSVRFKCVLNNEAVLDRETSLVWERELSDVQASWVDAQVLCTAVAHGNRMGWRLPTIAELNSLSDTSDFDGVVSGMPLLLDGVSSRIYWTATTDAASPNYALQIDYHDVRVRVSTNKSTGAGGAWCVRGPSPGDDAG